MPERTPLRVALLLDGLTQPAWVRALITQLLATPTVELALVILNGAVAPARPTLAERLTAYRKSLLYLAYTRFDEWRIRPDGDPFHLEVITDLIAGVPQVVVQPRQTKYCDYFEAADIEKIRSYNLDVAVRLGFRILKGDALSVARFGVWSYHHADNAANRGGPAGFWEVAEDAPVTGVVLQVLSEELDNGVVLCRSYSATNRYSVAKNLRSYYWKSAALVLRKLRDLYEFGPASLTHAPSNGFSAYSKRLYKRPTNAEMLRIIPRIMGRYAREKIRSFGARDQWFLAYKFRRPGAGEPNVPDGTFYNFKLLSPPRDRFWADPFPILHDGRHYVFFEELPYEAGRGHISVIALNEKGETGPVQVALKAPHHLSYPNVFEWRGELYMLPEAAESGRVQLYHCTEFPTGWEPAGVPLEGTPGADPTIAEIGGRWWLFLTLAYPGTDCWDDELHLYVADTPLGPWRPHSRNPVKSDVRSSRPAGRIFAHRGEFYRPAQDCSVRYGFGMTVHRIVRIDESAFVETPVAVIRPEWWQGLRATHTLNAAGDLTVIDGQRRRSTLFRQRSSRHSRRPAPDHETTSLTPEGV